MSHDDFVWVTLNAKNWDAPDRPLDLPDVADYDATAIPQLRPCDVPAATRQSATCEACLQTRLGRRKTRPHSLVWGECLRAPRPFAEDATAAEEASSNHFQQPLFVDVDPENRPQALDDEDLPGQEPIECFPHAELASQHRLPLLGALHHPRENLLQIRLMKPRSSNPHSQTTTSSHRPNHL